ncbi:cysteine hydrolase family protein [Providencia rustigianii]|uniref:cysteine hydrolase family protein n=1 Tax=Providencia rustigianii TaxID=158850 RepID=UPI0038B3C9DD
MSKALIIIDLINDIVGKNGLSNSSYLQTNSRKIIEKANQAASYARNQGIPVIWVKVGFSDNYQDIPTGSPLFQHAKQVGALKLSGHGCSWVDELEVHMHDRVMIKKGVSAFAGNKLHQWLHDNDITHLYFGGVSSVMAIQSSVRQAHDLGYFCHVLEDLCAAATPELHDQSMLELTSLSIISSTKELMQTK